MTDVLEPEAVERLRRWLVDHADLPDGEPLVVDVVSGGKSNLTLGVTAGDRRLVVRRPPLGHFLPTAHDMSREHTVQQALRDTPVPVADMFGLCDDETIIGAPFYVMARVDGLVPHEPGVLNGAGATPADNDRTATSFAEVLGAIHAVDVDAVGLGGFAKREGYLERQVARWTDQWDRSKSADSPVIDELADRLRRSLPPQAETTLVHGDYRLGNVMLDAADTGRIVAVFDWEMSTLGDPLADVGYTLIWWGSGARPPTDDSQAVADLPGFPSADELVERYASASGRDCSGVDFHVALAAFKLAVIGEGQRARHRRQGEAVDGPDLFTPLVEWALDLTRRFA